MSTIEISFADRVVIVSLESDRVAIDQSSFTVEAVGRGLYRVSDGARNWLVGVAGPRENRWVFVDGHVAQVQIDRTRTTRDARKPKGFSHELAAPMPATVVRIIVAPGSAVTRGDTLIVLEAMKMELPIQAPRDGVVRAVYCSAGERVQPGVKLLDLE